MRIKALAKVIPVLILGIVILLSIQAFGNPFAKKTSKFEVPVLMYHHVKPTVSDSSNKLLSVSTTQFREDLQYLKDNGYTTISAFELLEYIENKKELPSNPVLITFDDGYLTNYENAFPILKEFNMNAVMFVIGWSVGRDKMLDDETPITPHFSWSQAKEMLDSGLVEIQSHTYDLHNPAGISYGYKTECSLGLDKIENETINEYENRIFSDLQKSCSLIEENLSTKVFALAYPYGVYNENIENVLKQLNINLGFITTKDYLNQYSINRLDIHYNQRVKSLLKNN